MNEVAVLRQVSLVPGGGSLSSSILAGQIVAVVGPGASGKSQLLRVIAGREKPADGSVERRTDIHYTAPNSLPRRGRVSGLLRSSRGANSASLRTELLICTRLWEAQNRGLHELTPTQAAAAELLAPLSDDSPLVLIDGQFDAIDPWTLHSVRDRLVSAGRTLVYATHRPDLIQQADFVIVLKDRQVVFAGSVARLLSTHGRHELRISTERDATVQALVEPFEVTIRKEGRELVLSAPEGQELAAKLLVEGYGDIRTVIHRPPTIEEALLGLIGAS